jgi:2-keto-4-pentenoate hydratase/2-oxohepta-3-ene-1,7-dioic acid hydratase in catechol pathway
MMHADDITCQRTRMDIIRGCTLTADANHRPIGAYANEGMTTMRLLSYFSESGPRAGFLSKDRVYDLAQIASKQGLDLPANMRQVLQLEGMELVSRVIENTLDTKVHGMPLSSVKLAAPVPRPAKILALAGNYQAHVREGGGQVVDRDNSTPRVFVKPVTAVNHHEGIVCIPQRSNAVDYEIELGVVIGRRCRYVSANDALDYVAGYTVFNDISARRLVLPEARMSREGDRWFDWLNGKWFDSFAPMGPYLVTPDEVGDPQALDLRLWVNGKLRQDADTGQMVYTVAELIQWITEFVTLEPGDVIATGTPSGVGNTTGTYLQPGDVIEAEIAKIGRLRNTVAQEND